MVDLFPLISATDLTMTQLRLLTWAQAEALPSSLRRRLPPPVEGSEYVFSTSGGKAYDVSRFSKEVKKSLERAGFPGMSFRAFRTLLRRMDLEEAAFSLARRSGGVSAAELCAAAGGEKEEAKRLLRRLAHSGHLELVGKRYFLPGRVVPQEAREAAVVDYLRQETFAYRQDIAAALGLPSPQVRPLLARMVAEGTILLEKQRYSLP